MDFTDVAELAERCGRVPRRELRCHPHVFKWLRFTLREAKPEFPFIGAIGALTGFPVIEAEDFEPGAWELREDGEVTGSGHIEVPDWFIRLLEPVPLDIEVPPVFERRRLDYWFPYMPPAPMKLLGGIC